MDRIWISLALVLSFVAAGCAHLVEERSVRYLVRRDRAGLLELQGSIAISTPRAHVVMTEHCGGRWRLLEDGDALALQIDPSAAKSESDASDPIAIDERHVAFECLRR